MTLAAFVLTAVVVNVIKPRYTGETRVFLENRDTEYTRIGREGTGGREPLIDQDAIQSQVLIIQSRDIALQVIKKLGLASKPEFDPTLDGTQIPTKIGVMLGLITNPASMSPEERVLDSYADKLKVLAVSKSRVIAIEFTSKEPALAAKVSTAIAEEYINHLEQAKRGSAKSAGSWLSATIEPLRQRVATAEAKVEAFRSQNGLFQVGRESLTTISTQQLSELNTQLATARSQQSDLLSKSKLLREAVRQGRIFEISEVVNNDVVRRLLETRANLRAQIAQEEQTLLPQHPRIKELRAQLTGLEEQIRASAERTARICRKSRMAAPVSKRFNSVHLSVKLRQSASSLRII
jgi:polysaccharide biosynthesis transport protein